jgi:hypothetical protein
MSPNVSRRAVKLTTLWTAAGFLYIMMANQQEQTVFVQADSGCSNNSGSARYPLARLPFKKYKKTFFLFYGLNGLNRLNWPT